MVSLIFLYVGVGGRTAVVLHWVPRVEHSNTAKKMISKMASIAPRTQFTNGPVPYGRNFSLLTSLGDMKMRVRATTAIIAP
jgi:hypothetical protein